MPPAARDAFADALRQFEVMAIAGRQVVAGLGDADDRLAGLQFVAGQAVIQIALKIERGHARIVRIVEPLLERSLRRGHLTLRRRLGVVCHDFSRTAHLLCLVRRHVCIGPNLCMPPELLRNVVTSCESF